MDASKIRVAGTLFQKDSLDNKLHPISYTSQKLTNTEANSSAIELELLAVVHSVQQFRTYIYGVHFEIWTDHMPLKYDIDNIKSLSVKIQKLQNKLIDYDSKIIYRKGLLNEVCDAMSNFVLFFFFVFEPTTPWEPLSNTYYLILHTNWLGAPREIIKKNKGFT